MTHPSSSKISHSSNRLERVFACDYCTNNHDSANADPSLMIRIDRFLELRSRERPHILLAVGQKPNEAENGRCENRPIFDGFRR